MKVSQFNLSVPLHCIPTEVRVEQLYHSLGDWFVRYASD